MSYILNKTDGTLLVTLVDGSIDTTSTDSYTYWKKLQRVW